MPLTTSHKKSKPEFQNIKDLIHNKLSKSARYLEDYDKKANINTPMINPINRPDKLYIFKIINPISEVDSGESSPFWGKDSGKTEIPCNKSNTSEMSMIFLAQIVILSVLII